mgnify:CR=1 FL=1
MRMLVAAILMTLSSPEVFAKKTVVAVDDSGVVLAVRNHETDRIDYLRPLAQKGDARMQFELGFLCIFGSSSSLAGVDEAEGLNWIRKSAAQGDAQAQDLLGCMFHRGNHLPLDKAEAVRWFRMAAEQGYAYAQSNLGYCYYKGEGIERDVREAVRWFRKAAGQGELSAQRYLGGIMESGEGVAKDCEESAKWFFNLAQLEENADQTDPWLEFPGELYGKPEAVGRYRQAAEQGDVKAQFTLGCYYSYGQERVGTMVPGKPAVWSVRGVPEDHVEAAKWYRMAAEQGHAVAQSALAKAYYGGLGVPKDMALAVRWWRRAAELGHANSQFNLGVMCFLGSGTPKDFAEASKWFHARSQQPRRLIAFCGTGMPPSRPMVAAAFQSGLVPLTNVPSVR